MFTRGLKKKDGISDLSESLCASVCPGARRVGARVFFGIYAPGADAVCIVGSFNGWLDTHPLAETSAGMWETSLSLSEIADGDTYKFKIYDSGREIYVTDPYSLENDGPPHFNSVYRDIPDELSHTYENERHIGYLDLPVNIYEIRADKLFSGKETAHYLEIARETLPYILQMGYTHVCLSGVYEDYYDFAHAHAERSYFAPQKEQGGMAELRELVHLMHSSGIGVLLDWRISHRSDTDTDERFYIANALYWLDIYGIDGFVISMSDETDLQMIPGLIGTIRVEKTEAYFIARDTDGNKYISGIDATVKDCDAYCSRFASPKNDTECLRMRMAARAYLAFLEGRMITHMGCEIGQARWDAEKNGIDTGLAEKSENARFQLFVSDLNSLWLEHECLWRRDGYQNLSLCSSGDGVALVECIRADERLILALDLSGHGGEAYIPHADGLSVLLSSSSPRYGGSGREPLSFNGRGAVVTLSPYGVVVLG